MSANCSFTEEEIRAEAVRVGAGKEAIEFCIEKIANNPAFYARDFNRLRWILEDVEKTANKVPTGCPLSAAVSNNLFW